MGGGTWPNPDESTNPSIVGIPGWPNPDESGDPSIVGTPGGDDLTNYGWEDYYQEGGGDVANRQLRARGLRRGMAYASR